MDMDVELTGQGGAPPADGGRGERARAPAPVQQWVGLLLAPAVFFAHLQIGYMVVQWACASGRYDRVHLVGIIAVVVAAVGTVIAWRVWRLAVARAAADGVPEDGGGAIARTRFLGVTGTWTGASLVLVLIMQTAAGFVILPCQ